MAEINLSIRVLDVAEYILQQMGELSAWKLQKLVYYSQAWSLVWDERPLFPEAIEAWANGPVCPVLYGAHRGLFLVQTIPGGDPNRLDKPACDTIDAVLKFYGKWTSQQLSDLTHNEWPWREARGDLADGEPSRSVIRTDTMAAYYESLRDRNHGREQDTLHG